MPRPQLNRVSLQASVFPVAWLALKIVGSVLVPGWAVAQSPWSLLLPAEPASLGYAPSLNALGGNRVLIRSNEQNPSQRVMAVLNPDLSIQHAANLAIDDPGQTGPLATADGGMVLLHRDISIHTCQLARFDAQLGVVWRESLDSQYRAAHCIGQAIDGDDQSWALTASINQDYQTLHRVSADGVQRLRLTSRELDVDQIQSIVGDPTAAGVIVSVRHAAESADRPAAFGVMRIGPDGSVLWRWTEPDPDAAYLYSSLVRTTRGDVVMTTQGFAHRDTPAPRLAVLDAAGRERWRFAGRSTDYTSVRVGSDGLVLGHSLNLVDRRAELFAINADGRELWRQFRNREPDTWLYGAGLLSDPSGGLVVTESVQRHGEAYLQQERMDRNGISIWQRRTETYGGLLLPDGSLLATDFPGQLQQIAPDGTLHRRDLKAPALDLATFEVSIPFPLTPQALVHGATYPVLADVGPDGALGTVVRHLDAAALQVVGPDGELRWRDTSNPRAVIGLSMAQHGQLCALLYGAGVQFSCRDANTGQVLWERPVRIADSFSPLVTPLAYRGSPDGKQFGLMRAVDQIQTVYWLSVDADGQLSPVRTVGTGWTRWAAFAPNGESLLFIGDTSTQLLRLDATGQPRFQLPYWDYSLLDAVPLMGGDTLLRLRTSAFNAEHALVLLDGNGAERWRRVLPQRGEQMELVETADSIVVVGLQKRSQGDIAQQGPGLLTRLRRSDGEVLWQAHTPSVNLIAFDKLLQLDPGGQHLLYASALRDSYELQLYDIVDGRLLSQRVMPFAPGQFNQTARLNAAGQLRVLSIVDVADAGTQARVDAIDDAFDTRASPVGMTARIGAWYDGASAGQGWLLDVIPSSQTLYAAWFTFEAEPGAPTNTPARLRWYSLQGRYAQGAEQVELDILENRDGQFASAPATTPRKVGSATLRFDGCAAAVLDYRFDRLENRGRHDRVAWRALTIRDSSCAENPAEVRAGGFSSAASGAWFDPDTAGQGLVGVIQPPVGSTAGLLYAGWFHYDPAGSADDPRRQAWLTLQGPLSANGNGSAEVGIFRTLGGTLGGPSVHNTRRIGTAKVAFQACDRLTLRYAFLPGEQIAPYAGQAGTLQLHKLGGCAR